MLHLVSLKLGRRQQLQATTLSKEKFVVRNEYPGHGEGNGVQSNPQLIGKEN